MSMSDVVICDACGKVHAPFALGPMVHDHIWRRIAEPGECMLCDACMYERASERLRRGLTLADLRPCGFNLFHRPDSWFDMFARWEDGPPENLAEWQAVLADMER